MKIEDVIEKIMKSSNRDVYFVSYLNLVRENSKRLAKLSLLKKMLVEGVYEFNLSMDSDLDEFYCLVDTIHEQMSEIGIIPNGHWFEKAAESKDSYTFMKHKDKFSFVCVCHDFSHFVHFDGVPVLLIEESFFNCLCNNPNAFVLCISITGSFQIVTLS